MRGLVELPDNHTLICELRLLERRPGNLGKEAVGHPRGCHDDFANACCGALVITDKKRIMFGPGPESDWVSGPSPAKTPQQIAREKSDSNFRWRLGNYMRGNGYW